MMRKALIFMLGLAIVGPFPSGGAAQDLTAIARVDPAASAIRDGWRGTTQITLALSQGVPFRVFTLADPPRLVVDFREADWSGVTADALLAETDGVVAARFGAFQPGWSRLVADLAEPLLPDDIAMPVDPVTGRAELSITLRPARAEDFAAAAGAPANALWPRGPALPDAAPAGDDRFVVVIDPGHGGIDPGAERDGVTEKDLMLTIARSLRDTLVRSGLADVVLTRDEDIFVSLERRVALAHRAGADVFVSLHADILSQGGAQGATVYTLSDAASDSATEQLAARHNRADIIAGADLTGSDDQVAGILLDLARQETEPRSLALANSLVAGMKAAGGPMNSRPLRRAGFSVLKSADIPSILVEVGFLSSERDLNNLRDPVWRAVAVAAMADAILAWRDRDEARRALVRQ